MQRLHGKRALTNNRCTRVICSCISQTPGWGPGGSSCCSVSFEQPPKSRAEEELLLLRVLPGQEHPWVQRENEGRFYKRLGERRVGQR